MPLLLQQQKRWWRVGIMIHLVLNLTISIRRCNLDTLHCKQNQVHLPNLLFLETLNTQHFENVSLIGWLRITSFHITNKELLKGNFR